MRASGNWHIGPARLDVTFFIRCYNEDANVLGAVEKVVKSADLLGLTYEVIVFDDVIEPWR